ncbi:aconitase family protein [Selenihalanaerobacter shriftii]|uniref:3-isopropylmalate/(R)-2-methylmalate dehydratase large subunit n=1 Tax=Selenihalanaerobacter shriftii TaxID=142842 RepID=A0A1T4JJI9_9FIRM|nr:aconitase family protein [Selenihalanaerobacter shriftii]SJZ30340.1 3-isopropylmalate/(R)-2-methylmalate dehydratase large subunit [Selenihalanaerobacter shriftii]
MNIIKEYLSRAAGLTSLSVGDKIRLEVSYAITHDGKGPLAIKSFRNKGYDKVFNRSRIIITYDHYLPAPTIEARERHNQIKSFSKEFGIQLFDQGEGIIHQVLLEEFQPSRGDIIVGADGHVCTAGAYGAIPYTVSPEQLADIMYTGEYSITVPETVYINIEGDLNKGVLAKNIALFILGKFGKEKLADKAVIIGGNIIDKLSLAEKMTISNMVSEMNAVISYISNKKDEVGNVEKRYEFHADNIPVNIACPSEPVNVMPICEVEGIKLDQVIIGGCTNGRLIDMQITAEILKGKKIDEDLTLVVVPASRNIANLMDKKGISEIIRNAGGIIVNPGCGPCFGGHLGLLSKEDIALSTTNRNFKGRIGDESSKVYLASPAIAAQSAIKGEISTI